MVCTTAIKYAILYFVGRASTRVHVLARKGRGCLNCVFCLRVPLAFNSLHP
jgi:hypothetical protein